MELKTIKKTSKEIELEVIGENETIMNPIAQVLLEQEEVEFVTYMTDHPESKSRRLYLRVNKGKPEEALKKAIKKLEEEAKSFIKLVEGKKTKK